MIITSAVMCWPHRSRAIHADMWGQWLAATSREPWMWHQCSRWQPKWSPGHHLRLECWLFNTGELARHCKRTNPTSLHSEELMDLPFLTPGCLTRLTWRIRGAALGRTRCLCKVKRWWACPSPQFLHAGEILCSFRSSTSLWEQSGTSSHRSVSSLWERYCSILCSEFQKRYAVSAYQSSVRVAG